MTIQNRDSFLANISTALNRSPDLENVERPKWDYQPQDDVFKDFSTEELVEVFARQCESVHTGFNHVLADDLHETLKAVLESHHAKNIITPNDLRHDAFGLTPFFENLTREGASVHFWDSKLGKENQVMAERADVGITYSDITLAESATVCQFNNKNNSRTISLLPQSYIAIIPKSTLVPRLTQAVRMIHEKVERKEQLPSCISFISGPSNSGDIEMNLIVGVHGPVRATYILVDDM